MSASRKRATKPRAKPQAAPRAQFDVFNPLGPSVGIELRGLLERSDPRESYPEIYGVIFGRPWAEPPGPKALGKAQVRGMVRDVRAALKRLHPRLLGSFAALEREIREARLDDLTGYRLWLAVRFLIERQGHSEAVGAFRQSACRLVADPARKEIVEGVRRLRRALEGAPGSAGHVPLPEIAYGWPPELRALANTIDGLSDIDGIMQRYVEMAEVRLICSEAPSGSAALDPVLHVAIRALDRVLELDGAHPGVRSRRQRIARILDAVCPQGYRSDHHPFGPRDPQGSWSEGAVRQHAASPSEMEDISPGA